MTPDLRARCHGTARPDADAVRHLTIRQISRVVDAVSDYQTLLLDISDGVATLDKPNRPDRYNVPDATMLRSCRRRGPACATTAARSS